MPLAAHLVTLNAVDLMGSFAIGRLVLDIRAARSKLQGMPLFTLAGLSLLGSLGTFVFTQKHGGGDAAVVVSDHVLTGAMLYGIAALLLLAGGFFLLAAVMRTIRRVAALIAVVVLGATGGIGFLSPQAAADYQLDHACKLVGDECKDVSALGGLLSGK